MHDRLATRRHTALSRKTGQTISNLYTDPKIIPAEITILSSGVELERSMKK